MSKRICIVTPDIVGPMKNGGIGTACYWLALFLARNGYSVTALYTGPFQNGTFMEVRAKYAEEGVDFQSLSEFKVPIHKHFGMEYFGIISDRIYAFLKQREFDVIHFQDWQGNAFSCVQAKRLGLAFQNTQLVVGLHSCSLWEREGMKIWSRDPVVDGKLDYMEKYVIENADSVWAPSHAMLKWVKDHNIHPKSEPRVIRYLINLEAKENNLSYHAKDPSHLVFFGRLETRKGLELFTGAITKLLNSGKEHGIKRITFLGKVGKVQGNAANASNLLNELFEKWKEQKVDCKIIDNMDAFQAIRFIQKTGAIAIMPSLLDNYPYTVLECIQNQIPCLAAATGGIPEMLSPEVVFEPKVDALIEALIDRVERIKHMRGLYSREDTKQEWLAYSEALESKPPVAEVVSPNTPLVSICVAYYNYGRYLPQLLLSLSRNDYPNFEVIVVNDGSTDAFSNDVFHQQEKELSPRGWKFLTHKNQGIGATRNFAASQASGEFIIFMDADNIATPKMISTFVKAITASGADALTCIATVVQGDSYPTAETEVYYLYRPVGPILELGILENVFGDANAIMRKSAFDGIQGFRTDRSTSFEDWEFFALLALNGYKLDVVPEQLFFYRHQGEGFSRVTSAVQNQQRVMRAYYQHQDKIDFVKLMNDFMVPLYHLRALMTGMIQSQLKSSMTGAGIVKM